MSRTPTPDQSTQGPARLGRIMLAACATVAALSVGSSANAQLIATDSFFTGDPADSAAGQYAVTQLRRSNANGGGQNPTVAGFTGAWSGNVFSGSGAVAQWTAEEASITSSLPWVGGGRARFSGVDNFDRRVQRALTPYTASDTYYMSILFQAALGDVGNDGFVGAGFTNDISGGGNDPLLQVGGTDGLRGVLIGPRANTDGTTDLVVRHRNQVGVDGGSNPIFGASDDIIATNIDSAGADGAGVYHVILKLEVDTAGDVDTITTYVNPTDMSSELAASTTGLTASFNSFTMTSSGDLQQLTLAGLDYSRPVSVDEPRLATTFAGAVPIPEPTALGLVFGSLALIGRRRR